MKKYKKIQVGIAGFGMSGQIFHGPFLDADQRFRIKKVYERTTEHAKERYPYVETVRSYKELLGDDIDLVVIAAPNPLHVPMAEEAIEAGKHVIVEKPAAASSEEVRRLCRLAKERRVLFSVYQNRRLDGDFRTIRKLIAEGTLGDIVDYEAHYDRLVTGASSKKWKAEGGRGIGILYDLGVHIIDQAYVLFGMPCEVYADFCKQREESADYDRFNVILYYKGLRALLSAGEVVAMPGPHFMVHGRKGSYIKYGMDVQEEALGAGVAPGCEGWGLEDPAAYGILGTVGENGIQKRPVPTIAGDYGLYYDNFYHAMNGEAELLVNPEDSIAVLQIMEAAIRSAASHKREKIG